MPIFRATVGGASPLRIQLTAPAGVSLKVLGFAAEGMNTTGAGSRPVLTRPSVAGTGSGVAVPLDGHSVAQATVVTSFATPPTDPAVTSGSWDLPLAVRRRWTLVEAPTVLPGGSIMLYAAASGGHNWSGEIEWEEGVA